MQRDDKRLSLVVNPPEPAQEPGEVEPALELATELEQVVEEQFPTGADVPPDQAPAADRWTAAYALPATLSQVLEAASDAEARAAILDDVASSFAKRRATSVVRSATGVARINHRARILDRQAKTVREAASELRMIAARLIDESRG